MPYRGFGNPMLWGGARWSPRTGLYDMRFRQYDPVQSIFLSRDPLGYVDSFDEWLFAGGDGVNFLDPLGLAATTSPTGTGRANRRNRNGRARQFFRNLGRGIGYLLLAPP